MTTTLPRSDERRLHPLSWLFAAGQAAKGFIIPALLVLFASSGDAYELWAALFLIPITTSALLQYLVFRYRLDTDELVVRDGIVTRTERHIPYARIQNVDLVQNPLHRMLKVALVRVETASGSKPEALIRVLSLEAVEEMRARVFAGRETGRDGVTAAEQVGDVLLSVPASELIRLGIISNKGLVVVGAALGIVWQRGPRMGGRSEMPFDRYLGEAPGWLAGAADGSVLSLIVVVTGLLLLAAVLLRVFSVVWFLVQLSGFTLRRQGRDLRTEYGLFTRVTRTIPPLRIQTLMITESPLHRWFGRQSVELRTVGGGDDGESIDASSSQVRSQWLAPLAETGRVPSLVGQVLPEVDLTRVRWEALDERARGRIFRRVLVTGVCVVGVLSTLSGPTVWLTMPVIVALAAGHARLFVAHAGYALTEWGVVFKSGWWSRQVQIVRYSKVQTVARVESPFDRRWGMASLRVDTAGAARGGYSIDIPYLDAAIAGDLTRRLYHEASHRAFRW